MIDGKLQYSASIRPSDASNKNINWSITNLTGSAEIDSNGLLTPIAPGTIKVVAGAVDLSNIVSEKIVIIAKKHQHSSSCYGTQLSYYHKTTSSWLTLKAGENIVALVSTVPHYTRVNIILNAGNSTGSQVFSALYVLIDNTWRTLQDAQDNGLIRNATSVTGKSPYIFSNPPGILIGDSGGTGNYAKLDINFELLASTITEVKVTAQKRGGTGDGLIVQGYQPICGL